MKNKTIILIGASGSGKSLLENHLSKPYHGFKKVVSCTTRNQRPGEINGTDYYFVKNEEFQVLINREEFAEYEEYSQNRFYGTLKYDYTNEDVRKVAVLTPNGLRQLLKNMNREDFFVVYVESNLGTRMKRYIDRCGVSKFNYDDKNEICSRVERDFGMLLGIKDIADLVVQNNEGDCVADIADEIVRNYRKACGL